MPIESRNIPRRAAVRQTIAPAIALALGAVIFSSDVGAENSPSNEQTADAAAIRVVLQTRFPQAAIEKVQASPWPGLYEVFTPEEIVYTDSGGRFLFVGKVIDSETKEDLSKQRWNERHRIDFASLPLERAIKVVRGNGKRQLVVFADPLCPFCAELEKEFDAMDDVTIYTFLYPLETLHPGATEIAGKILCSKDAAKSWNAWMLHRSQPVADPVCDTTLDHAVELGRKLKINSTPTLFFADGRRVSGAQTRQQLEQQFSTIDSHNTGRSAQRN